MKSKEELSKRHYIRCLYATILLLSGFMCLLSSCGRGEDIYGNDGEDSSLSTGEMITVNFMVNENGFGRNEVAVRSKTFQTTAPEPFRGQTLSEKVEEGFPVNGWEVIPIAEDLYMHTILKEEVAPVKLRATPLNMGTKARVVVYSEGPPGSYTTNAGHADFVVAGGGTLVPDGMSTISVPAGTYKFVAYSYNDATPLPAFAETTTAIASCDLLWGETIVAVSLGNDAVHILLDHLFSQVKIHVKLNHAVGSIINDIQGAGIDHTFPNLVVRSNALITGTSGRIPFVWPTGAGYAHEWYSKDHQIYTAGSPPVVTINSITIDYSNLYTGPWTVNYATPLAPGYEYTLFVYFTKDGILCGDLESPAPDSWGNY